MKQGEGDRCCQYAEFEFKELEYGILEFGILTFGFWDIYQRISFWWMNKGEGGRGANVNMLGLNLKIFGIFWIGDLGLKF